MSAEFPRKDDCTAQGVRHARMLTTIARFELVVLDNEKNAVIALLFRNGNEVREERMEEPCNL